MVKNIETEYILTYLMKCSVKYLLAWSFLDFHYLAKPSLFTDSTRVEINLKVRVNLKVVKRTCENEGITLSD